MINQFAYRFRALLGPKGKEEINKKDYIFLTDLEFKEAVNKNKFIEHAKVFIK